MENSFISYGDVNPFEYGRWTRKEGEKEFTVIGIDPFPEEDKFLVSEALINITDSWIDNKSIDSYVGTSNQGEDTQRAIDILAYYGAVNCGGELQTLSKQEVIKLFKESYNIDLE